MKTISLRLSILIFCFSFVNISLANNTRYRLVITDDPATTITIAWDQTSGTSPVVYYGTTDHGTTYQNYTQSKSVNRSISWKGMNNNFAKLTGLAPNTAYYFVINDSQGTSSRYWFKTAPNTNDAMSFIAGGDSRNNRVPRQNANTMVSKLKPTAVFFGGDMTNANSNAEWVEWMDDWQLTIANDGRMFPIVPARGNHEGNNQSIYDLFDTPSTEVYYDITFGANLYTIYTLNSEISAGGNQLSWLTGKLNSDTSIWKSAQYHKPMRPHQAAKTEGNDEYANWAQLFYDNGIKLVYESDSHVVKTTQPVKPCSSGANCEEGFEVDNANGIVFVGEGCWGAPTRAANDDKVWTRDSGSFNQFKWVTVSTSEIIIKTIKIDNASSVGENSNSETPGVLPSSTDVWSTSNGDTVTITNSGNNTPTIAVTSHTNNQQIASGSTTLTANASDSDGTIASVEFKVDGVSIGTDTTSPYSITHNLVDGVVAIEVIATDDLGATDSENITLLVGSFSSSLDITASQDVEEQANNTVNGSSSDLELVYDSAYSAGDQTIGVEFSNISIPVGATVTNAYVQFTAKTSLSDAANYLVAVENNANAALLSTSASDVTGRAYLTGTAWNPGAWVAGNATATERTSDISAQIQSNVNLGSWVAGNRMVVKITADGATLGAGVAKRRAYSIDGSFAPVLHVEYSVSGGSSNALPSVSITSHTDQENVLNGTNVILTADASDTDGTIASVEFKVDGISVETDTTSPYSTTHTFADGQVSVEVIATDNDGGTSSETISLTIGNIVVTTLEAHYKLNGNLTDESTNSRDGSTTGSESYVTGYDGNAYSVSATNTVSVNGYKGISGSNARTVTAWIKTPAVGVRKTIVSWGNNSSGKMFNVMVSNGNIRVEGGACNVQNDDSTVALLNSDTWRHIAVTYDPIDGDKLKDVKIYIDGVYYANQLDASDSYKSETTVINTDGLVNDMQIGAASYNSSYYWQGDLDEVKVYSEALSASEIANLVQTSLVADFTSNTTSVVEGGSVNFIDASTNTPTSWSWSFSGATPSTSTIQNPSVTYTTAGTYDVTLTATNATDSDVKTVVGYITVKAPPVPVADFTSNVTSVVEGGSVNFTDASTNTPTSWSWSFSGGTPTTSTAQNPSVAYATAGTYDVTLTATNANGNDVITKTGFITVTIAAPANLEVQYLLDGNFTDSSTNSRSVTNSGVTFTTDATKGQVADFDGTDELEIIGYSGELGSSDRSFTGWIKSSTTNKTFVTWGTPATSTKWTFKANTSGLLRIEIGGGYIIGNTNVIDGQWHHVAFTFADDGTPNINEAKLYVDGTLETISSSVSRTVGTTSNGDVQIGNDTFNRYFNGQMSDVRIYSEALTAQAISDMNVANQSSRGTSQKSAESTLIDDNTNVDSKSIKLFPNPVSNELKIVFKGISKANSVKISVYNAFGQQVMQHNANIVDGHIERFNMRHLTGGIYFVVIQDSNKVISNHRIVKK